MRPSNDFPTTDLIVRRQLEPGNKMVLGLPLAHIPSYFADDGHCRYDIDAIDLGQVRTGHAKQLFPQVKWWIAFLFPVLALSPAGVFRQSGPLASIL
jgi:hypothetical protein